MKSFNKIEMKGRLYSHKLEVKSFDKGEAITGSITLEVDKNGTTVDIQMFARPTYNNGKRNPTYKILDDIMCGNYRMVTTDGDDAEWLDVTGNLDVSYYQARGNSGDEEYGLSRSMRLRGAFVNQNRKEEYRNRWTLDMLITQVHEVDADPEKNLPRMARVNGYLVDEYNQRLMEVSFQARKPGAIDYMLGLPVSFDTPYYCSVWGERQVVKRAVVKKNAFGDDEVTEFDNMTWAIIGMSTDPYTFGEDITAEEYEKYKKNLLAHKAEVAAKDDDEDGDNGLAF